MAGVLAERLVAVHEALDRHGVPHAFGGAIALAYATLDPRGTSDLDVNMFVPHTEPTAALEALPDDVARPPGTLEAIARDAQVRLWWDATPVDLFFDSVPIHADAAAHARDVPFAGTTIPVLGPVELVVFKALYDRTKDWADIEAVIAAESVDLAAVRTTLATLVARDDHRFVRLTDAVARATDARPR